MRTIPMNHQQFTNLFQIKPRKGGFDCYGTWNCQDLSYWADTEENARILAYQELLKIGYIRTPEQEKCRKDALYSMAVKAKPQSTTPNHKP